jgi:DNA gyrase inhibitor GyrI
MGKLKLFSLALLAIGLTAVGTIRICAESPADKSFTVRRMQPQVVLYTIYRGPYENIGRPIGELYAMAAKKKITPRGPVMLVYLNNPRYVSQEHCLTEIRIPVGPEAIQQAGTLGAFTDVKTLREMEVAVVQKQPAQTDYSAFYRNFYERIAKEGYCPTDNAFEVFAGTGGQMTADYNQMKSEVMMPVVKTGS